MGKRNKFRRLAATLALLFALPTAGCWDNKDINHRALPIVMGISQRHGEYKVVLQIPELNENRLNLRLVEGRGQTINEVVDRLSTNMESQIDLLHLKLILFENGFAKEGLGDAVESFMRSHDISAKVMVAICDEPIDQFFQRINSFNRNNNTVLLNFFEKNAGWNPQVADTHIWELYRSMNSFTHDVATPIVHSGSGTIVASAGSSIIRNGKMVGRLTSGETLLLNAFAGKSTEGKIEVMANATVEIISGSISHSHRLKNGIPYLHSKVKLKVTLLETKGSPTAGEIKQEINKLLTERYGNIIHKMKTTRADVLATGQIFRNELSRAELKRWRDDYLPLLEYDIEFKTVIQNTGLLRGVD